MDVSEVLAELRTARSQVIADALESARQAGYECGYQTGVVVGRNEVDKEQIKREAYKKGYAAGERAIESLRRQNDTQTETIKSLLAENAGLTARLQQEVATP